VIHGVQGAIAGYFFQKQWKYKNWFGLGIASLVMVVGYALATALLYTWPAGIASIFGNIVQNIFGSVLTVLLTSALRKIKLPLMKEGK